MDVRFNTTDPTEVAASLVLVVQSPWMGLLAPNATLVPVPGAVAVADVTGGVAVWPLEQPVARTKVVTSTTEAAARDRRGAERCIWRILRGRFGAD